MLILGIRKKYRNVRKYAALSAYLYGEMNEGGRRLGMKWGELGWTLEDNGAINAGIRMVGGKVYKKYRVYEKSLVAAEAAREGTGHRCERLPREPRRRAADGEGTRGPRAGARDLEA